MSSEEPSEKASLLFEECIEISDPEKQKDYLNDACRGKPELRAEVERLLRAHEESGCFLQGGIANNIDPDDSDAGIHDFKPGEIVGKYRLMGRIGEGSTSTVFLAEQEEPIHRWVALKIVKAGMDTRKVILRFGMERQALALMDHPGIAKLLDAGATPNGRPFFVMELVSGTGITYYCDENKLSLKERLILFNEVCSAVFHAHQRGIIHRDLKPDNILVSKVDGRTILKIVDFGIAKVLHTWGTDSGTQTGMMPFLGTPAYMSPEQVQLTSTALDTRTDIYSLGALLYEMLVGHPPFDSKYLLSAGLEEMCHIIRTEEPLAPSLRLSQLPETEQQQIAEARGTTPSDLHRKLSGDLDWIILKTLEKSRERRYSTTSTLIEDIKNYFNHLPVSAAKPSHAYRFKKLVKRKRKLVIATGIAACVLLVSTSLIFTMGVKAKISERKARESEILAMTAERESNKSMIAVHVASGLSAAENNRPDQALLWFANAARLADEKGLPHEVHAKRVAFWMAETSQPVGAFKLQGSLKVLEFNEDSQYLLAVGNNGAIEIWDTQVRERLPWTVNFDKAIMARFSPDGKYLAITRNKGEAHIVETASGNVIQTILETANPLLIQFSPDSRYVFFGNSNPQPVDVFPGALLTRLHRDDTADRAPGVMFAQASVFLGMSDNGWTELYSINDYTIGTGKPYGRFHHLQQTQPDTCSSRTDYQEDFLNAPKPTYPQLMDKGSRLLTRTGTYEVSLWDTTTGSLMGKIEKACCSCGISTHQQSGLVACGLQGGVVGIWDVLTGNQTQMLPSQGACLLDLDFGDNGTRLATVDVNGMARVWDIMEGKQTQPPMHHCTDVDSVAYSSDGQFISTAQADGLVRVWTTMKNDMPEIRPDGAVPTMVHMSEDGSMFVLTRDPAWAGSAESCIRFSTIFSTKTGRPLGTTNEFQGCVESAAFSSDSSVLALGVTDCEDPSKGSLEFHDLRDVDNRIAGIVLPSAPQAIAFHPSDPKVAVVCHGGELLIAKVGMRRIEKWADADVAIKSPSNAQVAYTTDGRTLVSLGPDGKIHVRDATTGSLLYPPIGTDPKDFWSFSLSSGGYFMATTTVDGKVTVWDLHQGYPIVEELQHPSWVYKCRFSPDNRILVTTSHDGYVRLWDWQNRELLADPMLHPGDVYDANFTPDGEWLLTACRDGNLRIFDPVSGHILSAPIKVGQQAFNIAVSPNGNRAVLGSLNNEVSVISLELLRKPIPFDVNELCLWGEVVSSSAIQNGTIRDLSSTEWLQRFETLIALHPELPGYSEAYSRNNFKIETMPIFTGNLLTSRIPNSDNRDRDSESLPRGD